MTEDSWNAFFALIFGWVMINVFVGFMFLQETAFETTCHSWKRIEYVMPGARVGCETGKVIGKGFTWLFGESK